MSGYFARLAAQVASPVVMPGTRARVSTPSLEQHAEVTAPMATTVPPLSLSEERQPASLPGTLPKQQAQTPLEAGPMAWPAERRTDTPADSSPLPGAMVRPVHLQPITSAVASPLAHSQNEASEANALAPLTKAQANTKSSSPGQPRDMPLPQVASQLVKEAPSTQASPTRLDLPRQQPALQAQSQSSAWQPTEQAAFVAPSFNVRPVQLDHQRESFPTIKPSNPGEAMPRTQVSIGTITLEVRAANSAPVSTPMPQPVAEPPAQAPTRFALRRHHVRWS